MRSETEYGRAVDKVGGVAGELPGEVEGGDGFASKAGRGCGAAVEAIGAGVIRLHGCFVRLGGVVAGDF